ncbi:MAG: GIY-YIG nuclease family protein [Candidatus Omnitrophota bacterium]
MFFVYVLKSRKNGKLYTGHTENLKRRILEHNTKNDKTKFSYVNGPWELIFFETFDTRAIAMKQEKFFKTGKGREYIKNKILSVGA